MLAGMAYRHFRDDELLADRASCRRAVEVYNDICRPNSLASHDAKGKSFTAVLNPREREPSSNTIGPWMGPTGVIGSLVTIETPFQCEYGYNINIGDQVTIGRGCFLQDAATIFIGDRTIIGPDVKFYCLSASVDPTVRGEGTDSKYMTGAIRIEEDCWIGGNVTILPFRTIGKGATVGAGSVVTRVSIIIPHSVQLGEEQLTVFKQDVKPYTVVAGNPAKLVRKRKIETGDPDVDRHDDVIQEENDKMLELMKNDAIVPRKMRDDTVDRMDRTRQPC